jgi:hypothetical protein
VDIAAAYESIWKFTPPRKCREMHAAGLFKSGGKNELFFAQFEFYSPATIAEGDAFVSQQLVSGLVPIGGDRTGDRWCFDTRQRIGGTIPVLFCPHDGGPALFVAPSFAAFVYRLVLENLSLAHLLEGWGKNRAAVRALTERNLAMVDRWMLRRWVTRANATLDGTWPTYESFDAFMRADRAFARMSAEEVEHFR